MRRGFGRGEGGDSKWVGDSSCGGVDRVSALMLGSRVGYIGGVCVCVCVDVWCGRV